MTRAAVAATAAAIVAAGCGGGTDTEHDAYTREMRIVVRQVESVLADGGVKRANLDAARELVLRRAAAVDAVAARVKKIEPPEDVTPDHAAVADGLARLAAQMREDSYLLSYKELKTVNDFLSLFLNGDSTAARVARGRQRLAQFRLSVALARIQKQGYALGIPAARMRSLLSR
jgi:hypothetical protein